MLSEFTIYRLSYDVSLLVGVRDRSNQVDQIQGIPQTQLIARSSLALQLNHAQLTMVLSSQILAAVACHKANDGIVYTI